MKNSILFYFIMIIYIVAATCALDAQIKLWDIESGKLIRDIDATPGIIFQLINEFFYLLIFF